MVYTLPNRRANNLQTNNRSYKRKRQQKKKNKILPNTKLLSTNVLFYRDMTLYLQEFINDICMNWAYINDKKYDTTICVGTTMTKLNVQMLVDTTVFSIAPNGKD